MTTTEPARSVTHQDEPADGRTARRDRNRAAVVEALLDLYHQGVLQPSAEAIAERAGLSPRSLFRYFDDADDLCRLAIVLQRQRALPVLSVSATGRDDLDDRVSAIVSQRIELFDTVGIISLIARLRAPFQPLIADELTEGRSYMRHQIVKLFDPELRTMPPRKREAVIAALDVLLSYESYDLLQRDQGFGTRRAAEIMGDAVRAQLS